MKTQVDEYGSFELAVKHARDEIDRITRDLDASGSSGEMFAEYNHTYVIVRGMRECDCVPVSLTDTENRRWLLAEVKSVGWGRRDLVATYVFDGCI